MTDPRLARIAAAARMPLPRLAADALAGALQLIAEQRQEIERLRATPATPPQPQPKRATPDGRELDRLRTAAARANATAAEALADLERAKAEIASWRLAPAARCKCGSVAVDGTKRCDRCRRKPAFCSCGAPMRRGASNCRECYLSRVLVPVRRLAP